MVQKQGGIHAVGHALLAVVPLFLLCDASDVDCEHIRPFQTRPKPQRILVFDKRPGGVGVSDAMFACHRCVPKVFDIRRQRVCGCIGDEEGEEGRGGEASFSSALRCGM